MDIKSLFAKFTGQTGAGASPGLDRKLIVVDVGCRWGFAEKFTQSQEQFHIYGFDPDPQECQLLSERYAGQPVTVVPLGLAGHPGERTLYVTQQPACSSLLEPDPELTGHYPALQCASTVSQVQVQTVTLDDWAAENGVGAIDHIKVDTQGTELEILKGGAKALQQARSLEIEVEFNPIYLGQPVFSDVDQYLRSQGFVLWKLTNHVHYSWDGSTDQPIGDDIICYDEKHRLQHPIYGGQLYWANAHYIKKSVLSTSSNSDAQTLRDIVLFHALGMPDVVSRRQQAGATSR
jgi:FkbM family methyltransferase